MTSGDVAQNSGVGLVYGLALAGSTGASEVIRNLLADFELTMGLAGCRSVAEITRESLLRAG